MTTQVTSPPTAPRLRADDPRVAGVNCLLAAFTTAPFLILRPLARLGEDGAGGYVAATVMIDVGQGPSPFDLATVRLTVACLLAVGASASDPGGLCARLSTAADQAEAQARALVGALH